MSAGDAQRWADIPSSRLRRLYVRHDGTVAAVADELGCSWSWARDLLERHDIHEPERRTHQLLEELDPDEVVGANGGDG